MNHHAAWTQESDKWPIGKAWKSYWRKRTENQSQKAKRFISAEKRVARRKMHRRLRAAVRRKNRDHEHDANTGARNYG